VTEGMFGGAVDGCPTHPFLLDLLVLDVCVRRSNIYIYSRRRSVARC